MFENECSKYRESHKRALELREAQVRAARDYFFPRIAHLFTFFCPTCATRSISAALIRRSNLTRLRVTCIEKYHVTARLGSTQCSTAAMPQFPFSRRRETIVVHRASRLSSRGWTRTNIFLLLSNTAWRSFLHGERVTRRSSACAYTIDTRRRRSIVRRW